MTMLQRFRRFLLAASLASLALSAAAEAFPSKAVSLVVPSPAGGPSDYVARQTQALLPGPLGQPAIVENVAGVGGALGIQRVLRAPADGHSVVFATPMELVLAPMAYSVAKFKPEELRLVAHVGTADMVLLARKDFPHATVGEMVNAGRQPGAKEVSYGSLGKGTLYHLVAERFGQLAGLKMLHVPYKGAAPALQDLMAGQIDLIFMPLAGSVRGLLQEGRVNALGTTSASRNSQLPSIPALAQDPAYKAMDFNVWSAVAVPRGVPAPAVEKLHDAIYQVLADPQLRKNIESGGSRLSQPKSLAELDRMYVEEIERFQAVAKSVHLQPE